MGLNIKNLKDLRKYFQAGPYAWPGGHDIVYLCDDGGVLCHDCVKSEYSLIVWSIRNNCSDGWRVVAASVEVPDIENIYCSHCNKCIVNVEED